MTKLFVLRNYTTTSEDGDVVGFGRDYTPATPAEIAEAAGVTELRQQRDALLKVVQDITGTWYPSKPHWNDIMDNAHAAIALCEPKQVTG